MGILTLRRDVSGDIAWNDERYVRWRYFDNPYKVNGEVPYLVFEREGTIIGGVGLEPITILHEGKTIPAVRSLDIMVRPEFEGRGLGALLNLEVLDRFTTVMTLNTNNKSTHLVIKLFQRMSDLPIYFMICKTESLLSKHLHLGALSGPASYLSDALFSILRHTRSRHLPPNFELRRLERFDSSVDLMRRVEPGAYPDIISVQRDKEKLNWRFFSNPRRDYRALGAMRNGALVGYVVYCVKPTEAGDVCEGVIADWHSIEVPEIGRNRLVSLLLHEAVELLIGEGASVIRCLASDPGSWAALDKNGFYRKAHQVCPFFIQSSDAGLRKSLTEGNRWFVTDFDNDVE